MSDKVVGRVLGSFAAVSCAMILGLILCIPSAHTPDGVSATPAGFPVNIDTIFGIASTIASIFGLTSVASFLGLFKKLFPAKDAMPSSEDPPKPNTDGPTPNPSDTMQMVLDLGTLGYHAGLYHASKDDAEKAKIREAALILNTKLFAEWFPESGAKS